MIVWRVFLNASYAEFMYMLVCKVGGRQGGWTSLKCDGFEADSTPRGNKEEEEKEGRQEEVMFDMLVYC